MALETGTYIDDLVSSNPPQSDSLTQAAGHLRLIKATILATFPNVTGAVTGTHTQINTAVTAVANGATVPTGAMMPYGGTSEPTGYLWCNGEAHNRTTYATLFAAIGTAFGIGDGTTTFNVPDLRDRTVIGKADMGGAADAAIIDSLLTSTTLGATYDGEGAIDTITLAEANIPAHTHAAGTLSFSGTAASNGAHTHTTSATGTTSTDGAHTHTYDNAGDTDSVSRGSSSQFSFSDTSSGITSSNGSHSHTVTTTGTAASNGAHTHTVSGTMSGSTGSIGSTTAFTVAILPPSQVVNWIIKT